MKDKRVVIDALRCAITIDAEPNCTACPYNTREDDKTLEGFRRLYDIKECNEIDFEQMVWYCNTEQMMRDAADLLENNGE